MATTTDLDGESPVIVAVMGVTGAGKSQFIQKVTGFVIPIGYGLQSCTSEVTAYPYRYHKKNIVLVDTPGFDDTNRSDSEVLRDIAEWLSLSYQRGDRLAAIIYMHRITDRRMGGGAIRNLKMFRHLLGDNPLPYVVLVTSCWDLIVPEIGEERERQLKGDERFWGPLVQRGSKVARSAGTFESAMDILDFVVSLRGPRFVLNIQQELVNEHLNLKDTKVGAFLSEEIQRAQENSDRRANEAGFRKYKTGAEKAGLKRHSHDSDPEDEAERVGTKEDLDACWNPDYGSLWLDENANNPPKSHPEIFASLRRGQFRLIELRAGTRSSPIEVSLTVEDISNAQPYSALSYAVGQSQDQVPIKLRHKKVLYDIQIGENLHVALVHLRRTHHDITLWIDAICINQNDNEERADQIKLMTDIFSNADSVCIWLGPATSDTRGSRLYELDTSCSNDVGMKLAKTVLDLNQLDTVVHDADRRAEFFCLARLMASPWFTRRWCVQEILMAKKATVHCGDHVMSWPDFVDMAQLLSTRWPDIQATVDRITQQKVGHAHLIGALALINISASVLRQTNEGKITERLMDLESLLTALAMFETTVSLDAIYSIYNLAKDVFGTNKLRIDYTLQPRELFSDVTELIVRSSGSLNIICHPWAPPVPLPSWIPNSAKLPYKRRREGFQYDRQFGVNLVNIPGKVQRYRACGDTTSEGNVHFTQAQKPILSTRGLHVTTVKDLGGQALNGNIPSDWLRLAEWTDVHAQDAPEAFWQTIVADQGPGPSLRAPKWYKRACATAVRESVTEHIDTDLLRSTTKSTHVKEYLEKVQDVTWSRAMVRLDTGPIQRVAVCLCPRETQIGDSICILYGCSVPVVLRGQGGFFTMIGECYIHGFMDGEAFLGATGDDADATDNFTTIRHGSTWRIAGFQVTATAFDII